MVLAFQRRQRDPRQARSARTHWRPLNGSCSVVLSHYQQARHLLSLYFYSAWQYVVDATTMVVALIGVRVAIVIFATT